MFLSRTQCVSHNIVFLVSGENSKHNIPDKNDILTEGILFFE